MHHFLLSLVLLCTSLIAVAQQHTITGKITESAGKAVVSATVSLLKATDSSWVTSDLTNEQGAFSFKGVEDQSYLIHVSAIGYKPLLQTLIKKTNIVLNLTRSETELDEVVIKTNAPTVQTSLGKMILNFEKAIVSDGSDVLELLRRSPGVTVDGQGNISMNGKAILITINDRQVYLSGEDLVNYLKSLSAKEVAQIELMHQPSAKYDAAGNSGIINIKTKKNKEEGWNASVTGGYGQGVYFNTHDRANFNYKKEKLTLYANVGYLHATGFLNQEVRTQTLQNNNIENSFWKETFEDYSLKLGTDYLLNEKLSIGGAVQATYHPNSERDVSQGTFQDLSNNTIVYNNSANERGFIRRYLQGNIYTDLKPAKDQRLTAEANYILWSQGHGGQYLNSRNYDEQMQELSNPLFLRSSFDNAMDVFVAKVDYEGTVKNIKLEAGAKASFLDNLRNAHYDIFQNSYWQYDTARSEIYSYKENINAAYLSISKDISKCWQAQIGLRAEQTHIEGLQQTQNREFKKSFLSLFPTVFVSYKLNDENSFELNFGRRIRRPSYRELNPFVQYLSQYNYSSGNPDLLPEYRYAFALKHNYRNILFTELAYARVSDIISPAITYDSSWNAVYNTLMNLAGKDNVHGSVLLNKEITKSWTISSGYDFYYNGYQDSNGNSLASSLGHSIRLSNQFNYKGWNLFAIYIYNTGDLQSLTERNGPNQWMSATVSKKIWKDTTTISFELNDPFGLYRYTPVRDWNGVHTESIMQYATKNFALSLTYNFGKKITVKQRENNLEEMKRM